MTPESGVFCVEPDCHRPAEHERLDDFTSDGTPIVDLVCDWHARHPNERQPWWSRLMGGRK